MDDVQWAKIEAKRAQNRYFAGLEQAAATAARRPATRPRRKPKAPRVLVGRYGPAPKHDGSTSCVDCGCRLRSKSQAKIEGTRPVAARAPEGGYLCTTDYSKRRRLLTQEAT
jgi:hypothetical protein